MNKFSAATFALITAFAASPAFAGFNGPTPEPEVAGGLVALGMMAAGLRYLRGRTKRG